MKKTKQKSASANGTSPRIASKIDLTTPEGLGWLSAQPGWRFIPLERIFAYGTAKWHRFQEAKDDALGKIKSRFGSNAGDADAMVKRLSTSHFYDTDSRVA